MIKRNTALFLSVILVFGFCLPKYVKADNGGVYNSSDAWYEPTGDADVTANTYNNHTEWTWERKDSNKDWFSFAKFHTDKNAFGMTPPNVTGTDNRTAGKAWTTEGGDWNHPAVGKGWMLPYMSTGHADYAVSKTFTAPKSGTVKLSTENGIIYGGSNQPGVKSNRTAYIRITLNNNQIWPESGEGLRIPEDNGQKYEFDKLNTVTTKINAGDKLRFEVYNGDSDAQNGKYVYWIPVVSYIYGGQVTLQPESLDDVSLQQIFTVSFSESIDEITEDNISISPSDNGETVKNVSNGDDGKSVSFDFEGLKGNSKYKVSVNGIRPFDGGDDGFTYTFEFTTEETLEYPVYESDTAWPENLTANNMTNSDKVWQWLYKNNNTKDTLNPYVPYTLTAQNQTQSYSKPPKNIDGSYDYATMISPSSSSENITRIYCDSQENAYARNSMGRWWMRPAVATQSGEPSQSKDNEIVKAFTAPETGTVNISAKDLSGNSKIYNRKITEANIYGAVLRIIKKCPDASDEEIWTYTFKYTTSTVPEDGLAEYDFKTISTDINKGEELWFVVSAELGGSAYSKQVFWNPVVEYTSLYPNITNMTPENKATDVAPNFEQKISFDYPIQNVSLSDIEIDGGATVNKVGLDNGNTTLCISYSNLKPYTEYNVKLRNVKIKNALDESYRIYEISFTTGSAVQIGEIYVEGQLKAGSNNICADVNNSAGTSSPVGVAFMVSVCKGTETDYDIISTDTVYRKDIGENDTLKISVNLPDIDNYFVKALLLEDVSSARALTPIKILKK